MPPTHRFLRACFRLPVDRTPIWIMRQAGRYLPEYRATRARAGDFLTLCKTPELAAEVTMQPLRRFPLDAAILFSDILVIPEAMGMKVHFTQGEGPMLENPIRRPADLERLAPVEPEHKLDYVMAAVRTIRSVLEDRVPLIGFSGSPWTLATYMVEGGSSKDFARVKAMLYDAPELMEQLLNQLADNVAAYLNAQIRHGAQAVQIFDTWGGVLGPRDFLLFSLASMSRVVSQLDRVGPDGQRVPVILFAKGCGPHLETMAATGCDVLGVDWTTDIGAARRRVGDRVALQGNMDPAMLHTRAARIQDEAVAILESFGPHDGHIFNLGHGITPDVDPDKVAVLVETVHRESVRTRSEGRI